MGNPLFLACTKCLVMVCIDLVVQVFFSKKRVAACIKGEIVLLIYV